LRAASADSIEVEATADAQCTLHAPLHPARGRGAAHATADSIALRDLGKSIVHDTDRSSDE
jgi:hypothetical protein